MHRALVIVSLLVSAGVPAATAQGAPETPELTIITDYNVSPVVLGLASLGSATLNMTKPSYASGVLGLIAGGVTIGVTGKYAYDNDRIDRSAWLMTGIGSAAVGAGIRGLFATRREHLRNQADQPARERVSMRILPAFDVRESESRLGFRVAGKF